MRHTRSVVAALAGVAVAALATSASAQIAVHQRGCVPTEEVYGNEFFDYKGNIYGGCLVRGAPENEEAFDVLLRAADAMGQLRSFRYGGTVGEVYLTIGDTTAKKSIVGNGTWMGEEATVRLDWDLRVPGARLFVEQGDEVEITAVGNPTMEVTGPTGHIEQPDVFGPEGADRLALAAWQEGPIGVYEAPAEIQPEELLVLVYLMPSGVIDAGRRAADVIEVSQDANGNDVLTIPVPELDSELVATIDSAGYPIHTEINLDGTLYSGDFGRFLNDRGDYEVYFPFDIELQADGETIADLTLDYHHSNPYTIYPVPEQATVAAN